MKITGYRTLVTQHEWGRRVGDVNGLSTGTRTDLHIVVLETDAGLEGVGIGATALDDIPRVFSAVEGSDPRAVTSTYDRMLAQVFKSGHNGTVFGAIGALDVALWDLKAKLAGGPLWRLLGGDVPFVPGYASGLEFGLDDTELGVLYGEFAAAGFSQAKVKGGRDAEDDVRRVRLVRDLLSVNSKQPALMLDANESWHRSQAVRYLRHLEREVDLSWVEEPLRRWDAAGLADVRRRVSTGVASGENLTGLELYRPLLEADALDVVQFNGSYGITHAMRVAHLAHGHDLPVSPVGFTQVVAHAMTAVPNHLTTEVQDLRQPLGIRLNQEVVDGGILLGEEPGAGISLDEPAIALLPRGRGWRTRQGPHVRPERAGLSLTPEDGAGLADHPFRPRPAQHPA